MDFIGRWILRPFFSLATFAFLAAALKLMWAGGFDRIVVLFLLAMIASGMAAIAIEATLPENVDANF